MMDKNEFKLSVRNLVEFMFRSGDITTGAGMRDTEAMLKGSKIHRKIQQRMGGDYRAEVPLSYTVPVSDDGIEVDVILDGRADGIFTQNGVTTIDEIKSVYADIQKFEEPIMVHQAQAMCYAYIVTMEKERKKIQVQMTYVNIDTEDEKRFLISYTKEEIYDWFHKLMEDYKKWVIWQIKWTKERNASIKGVEFPFPYREGQRDLVVGVYKTILRKKKLYVEAPTGVGKTISTVYPTVMAMGEGIVEKIFYLTAKTITRTVAEEAFHIMREKGVKLKTITLTAKEKICPLEKSDCNPDKCERAKGHFDRVNDAIYEMLVKEDEVTRELIEQYSLKYSVCPHEMALDLTLWSDAIICDYNYAFDPKVYLKRFFQVERKHDYCFLIDEAHNLVDRAREMYSATLVKDDFLEVKKIIRVRSKKLERKLSTCNRKLLILKENWEEYIQAAQRNHHYQVLEEIDSLILSLMNVFGEFDAFLKEHTEFENRDTVMELYFNISHFLNMYELLNDKYLIYANEEEQECFFLKLQCMDPSDNLKRCLEKGSSAVFFSATFLPITYYKEQLAGTGEDYAIYAPSPFRKEKRLIAVGNDVSTKYTSRTESEYEKVVTYLYHFVKNKTGNYLVFFPSYSYMNKIYQIMENKTWEKVFPKEQVLLQGSHMTEEEKEEFLRSFVEEPEETRIGLCVTGGIFGEGIDLKGNRLIGAVIVGTGLPMVCDEREIFRNYYEERVKTGFEYAYLYQGMNKVLQSAGRVIRTMEDTGIILLLDYRFLNRQYVDLFPKEWYPYEVVNVNNVEQIVTDFWRKQEDAK